MAPVFWLVILSSQHVCITFSQQVTLDFVTACLSSVKITDLSVASPFVLKQVVCFKYEANTNGRFWTSSHHYFHKWNNLCYATADNLRTSHINLAKNSRHLCNVHDVILSIWWPLGSDRPLTPMWLPTECWLSPIRLPVGQPVTVQIIIKSTITQYKTHYIQLQFQGMLITSHVVKSTSTFSSD